ncbi:MAG: histidine--tRNA ligase [Rhodospirillales bacterium]|jgi:histidyl-tRNA synthetase|nr:histidine--tRNA ligase [Rhodospirillales bacterium]
MSSLQPVKGTHDLLPADIARHRMVTDTAQHVSGLYAYEEIATPIFESTQVFSRTLGDTSDVVTKEMYTFSHKGKESITLRPENTASVMRSFMSNGMQRQIPCRFFYRGPMFRYERPQKGRQRQFHQIGIECIGIPDALADVEVIATGAHILKELGVLERTTLEINTLGDTESRNAYRTKLIEYFTRYENDLSYDSKERLTRNPMRILDSKDENDRKIIVDAPEMNDAMNTTSREFFDRVLEHLDLLGVKYQLNSRLVRGLDYYCHTAFEFVTTELGAQGAVMAGGRYDGLIEQMGGKPTPGVGWAAGVERLAMMIDEPVAQSHPISVIPIGDEAFPKAYELVNRLRHENFAVDFSISGNMKKRMNRANDVGAVAALMLGEDELARDAVTVRNMKTGEQTEVALSSLEEHLVCYR